MLQYLLLYFATAFITAFLSFPVLIQLLRKWELLDSPGKHKIHNVYKASMGGICIMLGLAFSLLISFPLEQWITRRYFFVSLAVMFITGLRDDILTLTPSSKLLGQILPIILLVIFGKTTLNSLYDISPVLFPQWLAWTITVLTLVVITNAYNLIDGIDGLAGTVAVLIFVFFGVWFYLADNFYLSILSLAFASSLLAFLVFNWEPSKIFMGDTGTLTIGFAMGVLTIHFINQNFLTSENTYYHFRSSISTAICVLIIPLFDTLRVVIVRLRKLQSPFKADQNHLHHQFVLLGFSHAKTTLSIAGINLLFISLSCILRDQTDKVILPIVVLMCIAINQILKMALRKTSKKGNEV